MHYSGTFISFEGLDGAGKSTQIERTAADLKAHGREVVIVREPGGTHMGELQRALVKADVDSLSDVLADCGADREALDAALGTSHEPKVALPEDTAPLTQLFMFNAARAQLFEKVVIPALMRGAVVIADRGIDSTVAYQSGSGGIDADEVMANYLQATRGIAPDLTIYCRLDQATRLERMCARGLAEDVIERTSNFDAILAKFDEIAAANADRFAIVDASGTIDEVAAQIKTHVDSHLSPDPDEVEPLFQVEIRPTL